MSLNDYEHFMEHYSFNDLFLLLDQYSEEQREQTELMEIAVMYGYASAKSKNAKLIKIFEKPKEVNELNETKIDEIKRNKEHFKNTFSNTL
ncbi:hypothetical protein [Planococcus halocryophilus]|uniref:hypothetical protein n=1 Tax=Planococcus halocryophilus TaxID=1215089 RepID=UPI001F104201|nr:hypothetical protein [Planococcus halocryophilus]MCH4825790.1 hypothetical protein [Planococcus halocryophilus]